LHPALSQQGIVAEAVETQRSGTATAMQPAPGTRVRSGRSFAVCRLFPRPEVISVYLRAGMLQWQAVFYLLCLVHFRKVVCGGKLKPVMDQQNVTSFNNSYGTCRLGGRDGYVDCFQRQRLYWMRPKGAPKLPELLPSPGSSARSVRCQDTSSAENIIDFSCSTIFANAFFHRLIDCTLPNFDLFELAIADEEATLIVPHFLQPFVDFFSPTSKKQLQYHEAKPCFYISNTTVVAFETRLFGNATAMSSRGERFRLQAWRLAGTNADRFKVPNTCLFIQRQRTRALDPSVRLYLKKHLPNFAHEVYFGNESLVETISKFSRSVVVVGFHGAGAANTVFCPEKAIIIELTLFSSIDARTLWRTNRDTIKPWHTSLKWAVFPLSLQEARIPRLQQIRNHEISDVDHYLKDIPSVHVPQSKVLNIVHTILKLRSN
jgi:hypothetical protein